MLLETFFFLAPPPKTVRCQTNKKRPPPLESNIQEEKTQKLCGNIYPKNLPRRPKKSVLLFLSSSPKVELTHPRPRNRNLTSSVLSKPKNDRHKGTRVCSVPNKENPPTPKIDQSPPLPPLKKSGSPNPPIQPSAPQPPKAAPQPHIA